MKRLITASQKICWSSLRELSRHNDQATQLFDKIDSSTLKTTGHFEQARSSRRHKFFVQQFSRVKTAMKFSNVLFAVFYALIVRSSAFEDGEEPCPGFSGENDCISCVTAGCGYVADEGDCVKHCLTVTDSDCFSTISTNVTGGTVADVCALAHEAQNGTATNETDSWSPGEFEEGEEPCPDVSDANDCISCVTANCGYVIDHGDCVKDCLTVLDSECFSTNSTGGEVADICASAAEAQNGTEIEDTETTATAKETATKPTSSTGGSSSSTSGSSFKTTTSAPKPAAGSQNSVSSAGSSMMKSLVQWTLGVASASFAMSQAGAW